MKNLDFFLLLGRIEYIIMNNNLKSKALLSVNPSFNFDFISDHIYSHFSIREFMCTESDAETKVKDKKMKDKN